MRVLHFATLDSIGGAAKATYRLHDALRNAGHKSRMIVLRKESDDEDVYEVLPPTRYDRLKKRLLTTSGAEREKELPTASYQFNFDTEPEARNKSFFQFPRDSVDFICLHWITGLLTVKRIRRIYDYYRKPLVWIPLDQEPLTGGCHYSFGCEGFKNKCGNCPQLRPSGGNDCSRVLWERKYTYLRALPITFVAGTSWVKKRIEESSIFRNHRIESIPLAIDDRTFSPVPQHRAKAALGIEGNRRVLFFAAGWIDDPRKGMRYLIEALRQLREFIAENGNTDGDRILLLVAGHNDNSIHSQLPFPFKSLGYIEDDRTLAMAYQAADAFVCSSIEEAGPMMIPESMLCGTPVVAFNTGGALDLIVPMKTGYLAKCGDSSDLAHGIFKILAAENVSVLRETARQTAFEKHSVQKVLDNYQKLFNHLLRPENNSSDKLRNRDERKV